MAMNRNLSFFMSRVQGVSNQVLKLEAQNTSTATPNQTVVFNLPTNTLLNLKSLTMHCNASTTGQAAPATGRGARLPPIECLVDRYEVRAGGICISQGFSQYGVLRQAKEVLTKSKRDSVLSHPEAVRSTSYVNGATFTGVQNETYADADGETQFAVKFEEAFLGTANPSIMDVSLLPDISVHVFLAGPEVISSVAGVDLDEKHASTTTITQDGTRSASFTLKNISLSCEVIGLASGALEEIQARRISEVGFLEIPFKQFFSYSDTHTGSTRFSVSTQSLDRIWIVHRSAGYDTQGGLIRVKGHKRAGAMTAVGDAAAQPGSTPTAVNKFTQDIGRPEYECLRTSGEKYLGKFFNFKLNEDGGHSRHQLQLNGSYFPGHQATVPEMYAITRNSVEGSDVATEMTLQQYKEHFAVMCVRLNLPDSEAQNSVAGVDTRGISMQGHYNTTRVLSGSNVQLFLECSSTLRVGPSRSLSVET